MPWVSKSKLVKKSLFKSVKFLNEKQRQLSLRYQLSNASDISLNTQHSFENKQVSYLQNFLDLYRTLAFGERAEIAEKNKYQIGLKPNVSSTSVSYFVFCGVFPGLGAEFRNLVVNLMSDSELDNNPAALFFQNTFISNIMQTLKPLFKEKSQALLVK